MFKRVTLLLTFLVFSTSSFAFASNTLPEDLKDKYQLVWSDEFGGTSLNLDKWNYRLLGPRREAVNSEKAVSLNGKGQLVIRTFIDDHGNVLTGMIGTQGKYEHKYGYYEVRMKLQKTNGIWSAFWIQSPTTGKIIGDPQNSGTEIDVVEVFNANSNRIDHALHWDGYKEHHKSSKLYNDLGCLANASTGYHTFGVEWTPKYYRFYIDGKPVGETTEAVSDVAEYMILSTEVGPKQIDVIHNTPNFEDEIKVDYVRVYQALDK